MRTSAHRKGAQFEADIRDYMRDNGLPVERVPSGMVNDRGDLSGIPDWTIEAKCYPQDLARAIRDGLHDLEVEQDNANTAYGAVIAKRRGTTDPGAQLVVMELWQFVALLQAQHRARREGARDFQLQRNTAAGAPRSIP